MNIVDVPVKTHQQVLVKAGLNLNLIRFMTRDVIAIQQCTDCGQYRVIRAVDPVDVWRNHADYCTGNLTSTVAELETQALHAITAEPDDFDRQYVLDLMLAMLVSDIEHGTADRHDAFDRILNAYRVTGE